MPTEREMGERHEFKWWPPFMAESYHVPERERRCKVCGLPPDAEVHREAPMRRETDCPHEAWEEIGGGRKCADCREWLPPLPSTEKPAEARDECRYTSYNARRCYVHGRERNLCDGPLVASTPPQAQPAETPREEWHDECPGFAWGHRCESCAPPPAQPEGEPKRIGGRTRMEVWELVGEIRHAESDKERERLCEDFDGWLAAVFGDRA